MGLSHLQVLLNTGKLDQALSYVDKIEDHYQPDHPEFFQFKLTQAKILLELGEYEKGEKMLNSLLDFGRRGGKLIRMDMVILLADFLWRKGNWDQAFFMIEMGEYDFTKLGQDFLAEEKDKRYAELKRLKGIFYRYSGELDLAVEYFQECLYTAQKTNDHRLLSNIYNLMGLVHHEIGDLRNSWDYFSKALRLRREMNDEISTAVSLFNIAGLQEYIGDLNSALRNYKQAYLTGQETGNLRLKANAMSSLGVLKMRMGQYKSGLQLVNSGLTLKVEQGNDIDLSWSFYKLMIYLLHSEHADLTPIFMDGLEQIYQRNKQNDLIHQQYHNIKATLLMRKDSTIPQAQAQKMYKEIMDMPLVDQGVTLYAITCFTHMLLDELQAYHSKENVEKLLNVFTKLEETANEQHSLTLMAELGILKAKFSMVKLNYAEALDQINSVIKFIDKLEFVYLKSEARKVLKEIKRKIEEVNAAENEASDSFQDLGSEEERKISQFIITKEVVKDRGSKGIMFLITDDEENKIASWPLGTETPLEDDDIDKILGNPYLILLQDTTGETIAWRKYQDKQILTMIHENVRLHYIYKGRVKICEFNRFDTITTTISDEDLLSESASGLIPIPKIQEIVRSNIQV